MSGFYWRPSDSRFSGFSSTYLSIFADFKCWGPDSFSDLRFALSIFRPLRDRSKSTNYNWYQLHIRVPQFFQLSGRIQVFGHILVFCSIPNELLFVPSRA